MSVRGLWAKCPFRAQPAQRPAAGPQVCGLVAVSLLAEERPQCPRPSAEGPFRREMWAVGSETIGILLKEEKQAL